MILTLALLSCGNMSNSDDTSADAERIEGTEPGDCSDGADNDADGAFDCNDDGCTGAPDCEEADSDTDVDSDTDSDSDSDSDTDTDSDTDADSDTDTDSDSDADSDTDSDTDLGPCAPPDSWTSDISASLYTTVLEDPTYDAGVLDLMERIGPTGGGTWGTGSMVIDGVVTAKRPDTRYSGYAIVYVADAYATAPVLTNEHPSLGDVVAFTIEDYSGYYGMRLAEYPDGWTLRDSGASIYVEEIGAGGLDYETRYAQVTHMYGEVLRESSFDCGSGYACFIVDHGDTTDLIRVPEDNDFGLDPDYPGGLCAEVIAPVCMYENGGTPAHFLDVDKDSWMRVWDAP